MIITIMIIILNHNDNNNNDNNNNNNHIYIVFFILLYRYNITSHYNVMMLISASIMQSLFINDDNFIDCIIYTTKKIFLQVPPCGKSN